MLGTFFAFVMVGFVVFAFGDLLEARLASQGLFDADRLAVYRLTFLSTLDSPWTGWGYGTFSNVFPMYRDSSVSAYGMWDRAHNTYLETVQGLGIPFSALFLVGLLALVIRCAHASLTREHGVTAPLVATSACLIVGLHAFVDFSLQVQAVAITWTALLAAGVARSVSGRVRRLCWSTPPT
jgi:O-antigen ligase